MDESRLTCRWTPPIEFDGNDGRSAEHSKLAHASSQVSAPSVELQTDRQTLTFPLQNKTKTAATRSRPASRQHDQPELIPCLLWRSCLLLVEMAGHASQRESPVLTLLAPPGWQTRRTLYRSVYLPASVQSRNTVISTSRQEDQAKTQHCDCAFN